MRNKFIILLIVIISVVFISCTKKYDILNAPSTKKYIVDYSGVLTRQEELFFKVQSAQIMKKYNIRIYLLIVTSSCGKFWDYDYMSPREYDILHLWKKNQSHLIVYYSTEDGYFGIDASKRAQKLPIFKELTPIIKASTQVFLKNRNYFKFFKFIFDRLEEELSKNYV